MAVKITSSWVALPIHGAPALTAFSQARENWNADIPHIPLSNVAKEFLTGRRQPSRLRIFAGDRARQLRFAVGPSSCGKARVFPWWPAYSSATGLLNTTMMLVAIIVLSVIGLGLYFMLEWLEKLVVYWRTSD
jgi:hypothetical protein